MRHDHLAIALGVVVACALANAAKGAAVAATNDCATVAAIVFERVLAHGLDSAPALPGAVVTEGELRCDRVAEAVSLGFTAAMLRMNVGVSWKSPSRARGDLCLDVHLAHCFPEQDPRAPHSARAHAYVADAWTAVRHAVAGAEARCPAAGDRLRVTAEVLREFLDSSLAADLRPGRRQVYMLRRSGPAALAPLRPLRQ
jgi:hypothetical protein